jgi:hypothetical protein
MLRNIPNRYTQASLIDELDGVGFSGRYDFFYLPMDVHNRTNVGYAFINFLTPDDAQRFYNIFKEYMFKRHSSKKIAGVSPAHVQGLLSNLEHFLNRAVTQSRDGQYRPIVFLDGQKCELQEALAILKPQASGDAACQNKGRVLLPWERPGFPAACAKNNFTAGKVPEARNLREDLHRLSARVPEQLAAYAAPPVEQVCSHPMHPRQQLSSYAAPPVEQVPMTRVAQRSAMQNGTGQDPQQYDEAFLEARKAFESSLSNLLMMPLKIPPPPGLPPGLCSVDGYGKAHENSYLAGSRTGTPRSTTSSADERLKENDSGFSNSEDLTPRQTKPVFGFTFSSSFPV